MSSNSAVKDLAYRLWEDAGKPDGRDMDFWLEAERQAGGAAKPKAAAKAKAPAKAAAKPKAPAKAPAKPKTAAKK